MSKINNERERRQEALVDRYNRIQAKGAGLYVRATPEEVAELCVREELSYMPDYIYDDKGSLIQVMFDRVDKN